MQMEAKQAGLTCPCAGWTRKDRAPGAPWAATLPVLLAALVLVLLASGAVLAVYYDPRHAFWSVQGIMRGVQGGWLMLGYHRVGAGLVFALLGLHLFRTLLVRGYRGAGAMSWMLWVTLLAVLLLTGWLGFVLQGGAGGHWALLNATRAAVMMSGFPGTVAMWFFGGPAGGDTLARLLVLHALLALGAAGLICMASRAAKRAKPVPNGQVVAFWPVYASQYFAALAGLALVFSLLLGFAPHWGQGMQSVFAPTPLLVAVPVSYPWYLWPLARLAGLLPGVGGQVLAVMVLFALLYALPWLDRSNGAPPRRLYKVLIWLLGLDILVLGVAGPMLAALCSAWVFFHFLVLTPLVTAMEAA